MAEKVEDSSDTNDGGPSIPSVTDAQRDLANQACQEFEKKDYGMCTSVMNKLHGQRSMDPKVVHNKAVADFYQSGLKNLEEFRKKLQSVCSMAHINLDSSDSLEDVDNAIVYYNQAVVLYNIRQYRGALAILDKLFHVIEPIDEALAKNVLLLLAELYLCTRQPEKANGVITYMEKILMSSSKNAGAGTPEKDKAEGKEKDESGSNSKLKSLINQFKVRCFLMMKSIKSCKREVKTMTNLQGSAMQAVYLKSNFEYLRRNFRKANKMLESIPQKQGGKIVQDELFESISVAYFNNLGCVHFQMKKHHLGAFYFRKAMQENERAVKNATSSEKGCPLQSVGVSRHFELIYNLGIQLLHCGKPSAAFDCLIEAVQTYQINPLLWLRLAECCIMANRENNDEDRKLTQRLEVIQGSVGSGIHRKLILGSGLSENRTNSGAPAIPAITLEFASLCLRNALMLLPEDPLTIVTKPTEDQSESSKSGSEALLAPAPPANPLKPADVMNLRCSILAASAYVSLCLNDHLNALRHAENLLRQPRLSGAQKYLGHLYMAEALVHLDRIADAIGNLNQEYANDISTCPPEMKSDQDKLDRNDKGEKNDPPETTEVKGALYPWLPRDVPCARAIVLYNLATAHTIRGEHEKAMMYLTESSKFIGTPLPAQMYFLKLYLDLMEGRRKTAQVVIKDHFGHVTPNRNFGSTWSQ